MARGLEWKGDALRSKMHAAEVAGLNELAAKVVETAKGKVRVDEGTLRDSIKVLKPAHRTGSGVSVEVGSDDPAVGYAAINELGGVTKNYPKQPFMRPAMDIHTPELPGLIKKHVR